MTTTLDQVLRSLRIKQPVSAPTSPAAGVVEIYPDPTTGKLFAKHSDGSTTVLELDGLRATTDYAAVGATALFDDPAATTGWAGVGGSGSVVLDTAFFAVGAKSIRGSFATSAANSILSYDTVTGGGGTVAVPVAAPFLRFHFAFGEGNIVMNPGDLGEFFVADGPIIAGAPTGNVVTKAVPNCLSANVFTQIGISLVGTGITAIRTFGIRVRSGATLTTLTSGAGADSVLVWFDYARVGDTTPLETGVLSNTHNAIVVPTDSTDTPIAPFFPGTHSILELRPGWLRVTRNGQVGPYVYLPGDLSAEVSQAIGQALSGLGVGDRLEFDPSGRYLTNLATTLYHLRAVDIVAGRAAFVETTPNLATPTFIHQGCYAERFHGGRVFGNRQFNADQSTCTSVANNRLTNQDARFSDQTVYRPALTWTPKANVKIASTPSKVKFPGGYAFDLQNAGSAQDVDMTSAPIHVEASTSYTFSASYMPDDDSGNLGPSVRTVQQEIKWYSDLGGTTLISTSTQTPVSEAALVGGASVTWLDNPYVVSSPAGAKSATLTCRVLSVAAQSSGNREVHAIDNVSFARTAARALTVPTVAVTSLVESPTGTYTVTTASAHDLKLGGQFTSTGFTSNQTGKSVATVPSTTTFTFAAATGITASGATVTMGRQLLDQPGDEIQQPTARVYGRDVDGYVRVDAELSGTGVSSETVGLYILNDETKEILASKLVTIAAGASRVTQTLTYQPTVLDNLERFSVRRETANGSGSVISHSRLEYRPNKYDAALEPGIGHLYPDSDPSYHCRLYSPFVEGKGGDAVTFHNGVDNLCFDIFSRSNCRQGEYGDGGARNGFKGGVVIGPGRSNIDIEPTKPYNRISDFILEDQDYFRAGTQGSSQNPWARSVGLRAKRLRWFKCGSADIGGRLGVLEDLEGIGTGLNIQGQGVVARGVKSDVSVGMPLIGSSYLDDNGNLLSINSTDNVCFDADAPVLTSGDPSNIFVGSPWRLLTVPAVTTTQNSYAPTGIDRSGIVRVPVNAVCSVFSIPTPVQSERVLVIQNIGTSTWTFKKDDGSTGTAAGRFAINADIALLAGQAITLRYDQTQLRWYVLAR